VCLWGLFVRRRAQHPGARALAQTDPELYGLLQREKKRQLSHLELIASEAGSRARARFFRSSQGGGLFSALLTRWFLSCAAFRPFLRSASSMHHKLTREIIVCGSAAEFYLACCDGSTR
jgi:hypothetical protein